jgi:hypothetical protein
VRGICARSWNEWRHSVGLLGVHARHLHLHVRHRVDVADYAAAGVSGVVLIQAFFQDVTFLAAPLNGKLAPQRQGSRLRDSQPRSCPSLAATASLQGRRSAAPSAA